MPVYFGNKSHDIIFGTSPIEKMGGDKLTYSMYGDNIPIVLEDGEWVVKVKCIDYNTFYLTNKGNLYGCGRNNCGQLGTGDTTDVTEFIKIATNVKDFVCGHYSGYTLSTTWYVDTNDDLYGCGHNKYGQQGNGESGDSKKVLVFAKRAENVKKIYCSGDTTWYIDQNNDLYGCGYNGYGQQGNGSSTGNVKKFTKRAENVKEVFCSDFLTWYIDNNNDLYGCGYNDNGNQGNSSVTELDTFTKRAENVKSIYSTITSSWYLTNDGKLYSTGKGIGGNGDSKSTVTFVKRAENVKDFYYSSQTKWYVDFDNNLYSCGSNEYGQLGTGNTADVLTWTKRTENIKDLKCTILTTWYIDQNNDLYGTGRNQYGQQGSGDNNNVLTFTKRAENVKEIFCGNDNANYYGYQTFYLTKDNELYGCGYNNYGQQGNGTTTSVKTFTKVELSKE